VFYLGCNRLLRVVLYTLLPMTPEEIDDWLDEAATHLALGELDEAAALYRKCVEANPEHFDAWHALGMCLMKSDRVPEAIEAGLETVRIRPNDQLAWSSLSLMYVRNHQIPEAEAAGTKAKILSWGGKIAPEPPAANPENPASQ